MIPSGPDASFMLRFRRGLHWLNLNFDISYPMGDSEQGVSSKFTCGFKVELTERIVPLFLLILVVIE